MAVLLMIIYDLFMTANERHTEMRERERESEGGSIKYRLLNNCCN